MAWFKSQWLRVQGLSGAGLYKWLCYSQAMGRQLSDNQKSNPVHSEVKGKEMESRQTPSVAGGPAAASNPRARRPGGLVGEIVASLSERVQQGQWPAGHKLPSESEIMAEFEVSRTVVREALSRLQAAGAVETRHGIGTFVLAPRESANFSLGSVDLAMVGDVIALLELRISLETEAAGLAAQRRTDAQLAQMQTALDDFQAALGQENDAVPSDFAFHMEVARATHNRHLADLMGYLGTIVIPRARINTAQAAPEGRLNYLQKVHGEHESILSAIRNQDPEAARAAMRTHLSNSRERLRKTQSSEAPKTT